MKQLQPITSSLAALFRVLPVPARVAGVIVGVFVMIYVWQLLLGLVFLAAFGIGIYTIIKWFVSR